MEVGGLQVSVGLDPSCRQKMSRVTGKHEDAAQVDMGRGAPSGGWRCGT